MGHRNQIFVLVFFILSFIFVFIVYFNINLYVILLYFIRMMMMKYDITSLLGNIELQNKISFTDSLYIFSINR